MKLLKAVFALIVTVAGSFPAWADDDPTILSICMENGFWAPYLFMYDNQPTGIHTDMVRHALKTLNIKSEIKALPLKRCMELNKLGKVDAVLSASYSEERAEYLLYPDTAATMRSSPHRLSLVGYSFITRKDTAFHWTGDFQKVPQPIGIPLGYGTGARLEKRGLQVTYGLRYDDIFGMLERGRVNALAIGSELADIFLSQERYRDMLIKHPPDYESSSLFVPFSKKSSIDPAMIQLIWHAIADIRENQQLMQQFRTTAAEQTQECLQRKNHCH